jgi:hypothetical protein
MDIESVAHEIVDAAIKVHRSLGPGLLESAYQACHVSVIFWLLPELP